MQKALHAIIGENQSAAIEKRTILHIRDVTDASNKLNNLALIWDFMPFLTLLCHKFALCKSILPFLSLVMETNSFT